MNPRWGDMFSTEQTNHCSPTCTLIVCGCNDNACSPERSYCLIMMMCSVREKTSCTSVLKRRGKLARSCSPDVIILFMEYFLHFFWIANNSSFCFISFFFFWNETAFNCALVQCAWICWDTMGTLWSLSCHWHLLMKPIPIPIPTHLWADPHLAYQWLPALLKWFWPSVLSHKNTKLYSPLLYPSFTTSCTPWLQIGLGALGLVSAGCHGLMKAVWPHDHAADISAYLCIRGASSRVCMTAWMWS